MRVLFTQKMAGIAGSETYYLKLLPALRTYDVHPTFLVVEEHSARHLNDAFVETLRAADIQVERRISRGPISWRLLREICAIVKNGCFDLVQSNLIHADVWMAAVKRLFVPHMKLISTKHGYSEHYQLQHGFDPTYLRWDLFSALTRVAGIQADKVVAISRGLGHLLTSSGLIRNDKLCVIPYGFSFDDAVSKLPPGTARFGRPQIITVGRLVPVKQHSLLLSVLPRLVEHFPNLKLIVVGDGPEEPALRALADELGITQNVLWTGFVSNVHDYLRDSDVFVFPSRAEGFGAVTLEAWYNRLPIIAFDVPAQNEIINNSVDGFLIDPFDTESLHAHILTLLEDDDLRHEIAREGRRSYEERYTLDVMVRNTVDLYRSVLAESSAEYHD
jgi:glycosyltransferase involved in cell wall biosynthesis